MAGFFAHGTAPVGALALSAPIPYDSMLTLEDGTIVEDADTYALAATVATYATRYGATWSPSTELLGEQAILRGMVYIEDQEWKFCGYRVSEAQGLAWPRTYVPNMAGGYLSSTAIPKGIVNALCEAAILELATPGILVESSRTQTGGLIREKKKVGKIERELEYSDIGLSSSQKSFDRIKAFLAPYVCSTGVVDVVRA